MLQVELKQNGDYCNGVEWLSNVDRLIGHAIVQMLQMLRAGQKSPSS